MRPAPPLNLPGLIPYAVTCRHRWRRYMSEMRRHTDGGVPTAASFASTNSRRTTSNHLWYPPRSQMMPKDSRASASSRIR